MRRIVIAALAVTMTLAATPAAAADRHDPDDSASRLDIATVRVEVEDRVGTFVVRTHDRWRSRFLRDSLPTSLRLYLDSDRDGKADVVGNFRYVRDELFLVLRGANGDRYEWVKATRPTGRAVKAVFPVDLPALSGRHLDVWARSSSSVARDCPSTPCTDRAPNRGAVAVY